MPQTELLDRLDQAIELTSAFGPAFLALHALRLDILTAQAKADTDADLDAEFQNWLAEQDYKETCLWSNY
ncbi:MAG: hypothetical protein H7Y22_06280 [Gemmatimonadaceae bacterium]|nr:hypothetical protein [Gloeobacterales cyanobacterium ES-bin-141]